jgi:Plavaka transposase
MDPREDDKCPYCSRRFQYAGAFENHIQRCHPVIADIMTSSRNYRDEDSDTENPLSFFESHGGDMDCDGDSDYEDQKNNGTEDSETPSNAVEDIVFASAGLAVSDAPEVLSEAQNALQNPYTPFASAFEFNLAHWFVDSGIPKTRINSYFNRNLCTMQEPEINFRSGHTLQQLLERMDLEYGIAPWVSAQATAVISGETHKIPFFYRDPLDCIRFLLKQPPYRDYLVFAPMRQFNESGERVYTDMYTADWWWRTQVISYP